MIKGFEKQTSELNEDELRLAHILANKIKNNRGESWAVTNSAIERGLREHNAGKKIGASRIRKMINYIRINHLVLNLISSSKGYWVEEDPYKINEYVEGLRSRASAIEAVADSFSDYTDWKKSLKP